MRKRNLANLRLSHIAAVDRPCQEGAKAMIIKRAPDDPDPFVLDLVSKYVCDTDGAHSFTEVLSENEFSQKIWPFTDALSQSIRSIVGDKRLTGVEREDRINESVAAFLSNVREISPQVAKQLEGLVSKKERQMPKTVQELEADLAKVNGELETATSKLALATGQVAELTARAEKAEGERDAAKAEGGEAATLKAENATLKADLAKATEETLTVGEVVIKRSEVGDAQFAVSKALVEERDLARIEKRAGDEFAHVVGTVTEKALVIKAIEALPNETAKTAGMAILASAEKMAKGAFSLIGGQGGQQPTEKQAEAVTKYQEAVAKNVSDGMKESEAMSKVRREQPELFKEAYPAESAGAN